MVTLLHALTRANPRPNTQDVSPGINTTVRGSILPDTWIPWTDFNYDTLTSIFEGELGGQYEGDPDPDPLPLDLRICNEDTLQTVLQRFIMPTVNYSLHGQAGGCHYGPGSRCAVDIKPDWSCIAHGQYINVVPGDTKLSAKWWPNMSESRSSGVFHEWQKVVGQVSKYMAYSTVRYGFIITDASLVALRITRLATSPGLTAGRLQRATAGGGHRINFSGLSIGEESSFADESSLANESSFADVDPLDWEYQPPEYAVIPCGNSGTGRLTVKLALWCLAMMSANGDNFLDLSYPGLDTWRKAEKGYVHNTSGAIKRRLHRDDDVHQEPDPERAARQAAQAGPSVYAEEPEEGDAGRVDDCVPQFSQTAVASGEGNAHSGDGNEEEEEVPAPKLKTVEIKRRRSDKTLYFVDAKGKEVDTRKSKWTTVPGGYQLRGKKHTYFTKSFPI
ncbi:hypothetical protein QBC33DRAFT_197619 [Phialemonium atrogriseum]|uniref:Uncharacterized protein n=1 Tax=Phialemonium atrogriseum TaxID=1093897 RepID=A0AAJ0FIH5_9PEZI|nr:uncharacterized protein QBC33DRAFT_197619 [Phialemonium atrogriseum]KAK1764383.1 hypothetical protein QBC33DRAFT_197619 [Phialemonium atrogriseum]